MALEFYSKDSEEYQENPNDIAKGEHFGGVQVCYGR